MAFSDSVAEIAVRYRTQSNEQDAPITAGRLTIRARGRSYTLDLADVLPIRTHRVALPSDYREGCGATQALLQRSHYAVVESIWAEKGCLARATFVDLDTGVVAQTVDLNHRWDHRLDVVPERFVSSAIRVTGVEHVDLEAMAWDPKPRPLSWPFALLRGVDERGHSRLLAFEVPAFLPDGLPDPGRRILPSAGSTVFVGTLSGPLPAYVEYHPDPYLLRMSVADDARYAARQVPLSPESARRFRRNQWFSIAEDYAARGQVTQAVRAFAMMLANEDDSSLYAGERDMLARCRSMAAQVRANRLSIAAAKNEWQYGCQTQAAMMRSLATPTP